MLSNQLAELISAHGSWIVAVVVALESMGIPAPGETVLVTAAIFAGTTQRLNIAWIIVAAAIGAITVAFVGLALAGTACVAAFWWLRRHEAALAVEAEQALPGPLPRPGFARF